MRYRILPLTLIVNEADVVVSDVYLPSILFYGDTPVGTPRIQQPFVTLSGGDIRQPYLLWNTVIYAEMFVAIEAETSIYEYLVESLRESDAFGLQWLPLRYRMDHESVLMFDVDVTMMCAIDGGVFAMRERKRRLGDASVVSILSGADAMDIVRIEDMRNASMFMAQDVRDPFYYIGIVDFAVREAGPFRLHTSGMWEGVDVEQLLFAFTIHIGTRFVDVSREHYRFATIGFDTGASLEGIVSPVQFISASIL